VARSRAEIPAHCNVQYGHPGGCRGETGAGPSVLAGYQLGEGGFGTA